MCTWVCVEKANGDWEDAVTSKGELADALGVNHEELVMRGEKIAWDETDCLCPLDEKATAEKLGLRLEEGWHADADFIGDYAFRQPFAAAN